MSKKGIGIAILLGLISLGLIAGTGFLVVAGKKSGKEVESRVTKGELKKVSEKESEEDEDDDQTEKSEESVLVTPIDGKMEFTADGSGTVAEAQPREKFKKKAKKKIQGGSEEYIFPSSDTEMITEAEAAALSTWDAQMAINEIMARKGRRFKDAQIQAYFDAQSWYTGTVDPDTFDANQASYLNATETANVNLLSKYR